MASSPRPQQQSKQSQQEEAGEGRALDLDQAEAILAGVLAAAKAAVPEKGLDFLVWGAAHLGDRATVVHLLANGGGTSWAPWGNDDQCHAGPCPCPTVAAASNGCKDAVKELLESQGVDADEAQTCGPGDALVVE